MKRSIKDFFSVAKNSERIRSNLKESVSFLEYLKETLIISGIILFSFILIGFFMGTMKNFIYVFIMITVLIGSSFLLLRIRFEKYVMKKNNVVYDSLPVILLDMMMLGSIWFVSNGIFIMLYMSSFINIWFIVIVVFLGLASYFLGRLYLSKVKIVDLENDYVSKVIRSIFFIVISYIGMIYILPSMEVSLFYSVSTIMIVILYMIRMLLQSVVVMDSDNFRLIKGILITLVVISTFASFQLNDFDDEPKIPPFRNHVNRQGDFDVEKVAYNYIEHNSYYFTFSKVYDEEYDLVHTYQTNYIFRELDGELYAIRNTMEKTEEYDYIYEFYRVEDDFSLTHILDTDFDYYNINMIEIEDTWYGVPFGTRSLSRFYPLELNSEERNYVAPKIDDVLSVSDENIIFVLGDEVHNYTTKPMQLYYKHEPYYLYSNWYFILLDESNEHSITLLSYEQLTNGEDGVTYTSDDINFYYNIREFRVIDDTLYIQAETVDHHDMVITFDKEFKVKEELIYYRQDKMYYNFIIYGDELIVYLDIQDQDNVAYVLDVHNIGIFVNSSQTRYIHEGIILLIIGLVFLRRKPVMNFKRGGRI